MRVLIVDDDPQNRLLLKLFCKKWGYEVIEAKSGTEGIKKAKEEKPSVILLDLLLGDIKGEEVIKLLKSQQETKNLPVIVISAYDICEVEGADAVFPKPLDFSLLRLTLQKITRNL
ncbi:MAG: hypothetical protein DSY32_02810 [Aquifex sp.]|nr:MAG: hypothetical protein DSY32_02810 [Aquifex sp.]